jgi:hypothetical protein
VDGAVTEVEVFSIYKVLESCVCIVNDIPEYDSPCPLVPRQLCHFPFSGVRYVS